MVAGIIAATHNNGLGSIAGVAQNVQIVPINIFNEWLLLPRGWDFVESNQSIIDAFDFARDPNRGNADVINNSWSFRTTNAGQVHLSSGIIQAITSARIQGRGGLGCVVVFSSGNFHGNCNGCFSGVAFPANVNGVISVGAVNRQGTV